MKRLGNGTGSVYKLSGNRQRPWAARKTVGWNENGYPKYKFIGYYRTRTEAMSALMAYNKDPYSLDGERLIDMYNGFITGYEQNHSAKSLYNITGAWNHLLPLADVPVANMTRKQLQIFFDGLEVSQQRKQKVLSVLRQIMDYSIRYDVIQPERITILKYIDLTSSVPVKKTDRKVFTAEEIDKLWQMDDDIARMLLFMIYTGLRAGEYCGMDIEDGIIHIRSSKTAAGIRDVPLSDKAQKLAHMPLYDDYFRIKYHFTIWRQKHGFEHTLHDTRHTCVSLLANAGIDKRIIQSIVGHQGKDVTDKVYTHIDLEVMREALNKI